MMASPSPSPSAAGSRVGPTATNSTTNSPVVMGPRAKCDQVVYEAMAKASEIVVLSRRPADSDDNTTPPSPGDERVGGTGGGGSGRFNLEMVEVPYVRKSLNPWRGSLHVPLRLDVYYHEQDVGVNGDGTCPPSSEGGVIDGGGDVEDGIIEGRVLLERWCVDYVPLTSTPTSTPSTSSTAPDNDNSPTSTGGNAESQLAQLRRVCRRVVIALRTLHCLARMLPAHNLSTLLLSKRRHRSSLEGGVAQGRLMLAASRSGDGDAQPGGDGSGNDVVGRVGYSFYAAAHNTTNSPTTSTSNTDPTNKEGCTSTYGDSDDSHMSTNGFVFHPSSEVPTPYGVLRVGVWYHPHVTRELIIRASATGSMGSMQSQRRKLLEPTRHVVSAPIPMADGGHHVGRHVIDDDERQRRVQTTEREDGAAVEEASEGEGNGNNGNGRYVNLGDDATIGIGGGAGSAAATPTTPGGESPAAQDVADGDGVEAEKEKGVSDFLIPDYAPPLRVHSHAHARPQSVETAGTGGSDGKGKGEEGRGDGGGIARSRNNMSGLSLALLQLEENGNGTGTTNSGLGDVNGNGDDRGPQQGHDTGGGSGSGGVGVLHRTYSTDDVRTYPNYRGDVLNRHLHEAHMREEQQMGGGQRQRQQQQNPREVWQPSPRQQQQRPQDPPSSVAVQSQQNSNLARSTSSSTTTSSASRPIPTGRASGRNDPSGGAAAGPPPPSIEQAFSSSPHYLHHHRSLSLRSQHSQSYRQPRSHNLDQTPQQTTNIPAMPTSGVERSSSSDKYGYGYNNVPPPPPSATSEFRATAAPLGLIPPSPRHQPSHSSVSATSGGGATLASSPDPSQIIGSGAGGYHHGGTAGRLLSSSPAPFCRSPAQPQYAPGNKHHQGRQYPHRRTSSSSTGGGGGGGGPPSPHPQSPGGGGVSGGGGVRRQLQRQYSPRSLTAAGDERRGSAGTSPSLGDRSDIASSNRRRTSSSSSITGTSRPPSPPFKDHPVSLVENDDVVAARTMGRSVHAVAAGVEGGTDVAAVDAAETTAASGATSVLLPPSSLETLSMSPFKAGAPADGARGTGDDCGGAADGQQQQPQQSQHAAALAAFSHLYVEGSAAAAAAAATTSSSSQLPPYMPLVPGFPASSADGRQFHGVSSVLVAASASLGGGTTGVGLGRSGGGSAFASVAVGPGSYYDTSSRIYGGGSASAAEMAAVADHHTAAAGHGPGAGASLSSFGGGGGFYAEEEMPFANDDDDDVVVGGVIDGDGDGMRGGGGEDEFLASSSAAASSFAHRCATASRLSLFDRGGDDDANDGVGQSAGGTDASWPATSPSSVVAGRRRHQQHPHGKGMSGSGEAASYQTGHRRGGSGEDQNYSIGDCGSSSSSSSQVAAAVVASVTTADQLSEFRTFGASLGTNLQQLPS